jgi:hypothetical protein
MVVDNQDGGQVSVIRALIKGVNCIPFWSTGINCIIFYGANNVGF